MAQDRHKDNCRRTFLTVRLLAFDLVQVHIDETRGTLQFASRARRVTTCAQVNEVLLLLVT